MTRTVLRWLKGVFTEHLVAKVFAIAFATAVVYLVEQELREVWYDGEIEVITLAEAQQRGEPSTHRIVLHPERGVVIDVEALRRQALRIRILGPKKDTVEFSKVRDIRVDVKRSWAREDPGWGDYVLHPEDIRLSLDGAIVRFADEIRYVVPVELAEELRDVPVQVEPPDPKTLRNARFDPEATSIQPPRVTVRGPRFAVRRMQGRSIEVQLEPRRSYEDGKTYRATLARKHMESLLSMVPAEVGVTLGLKRIVETVEATLRLPMEVVLTPRDLKAIAAGELVVERKVARSDCAVTVALPADEAPDRAELAKQLRAVILLSKAIEASASRAEVKVLGLPPGVSVRKIDPASIPYDIKRG